MLNLKMLTKMRMLLAVSGGSRIYILGIHCKKISQSNIITKTTAM
jgi:hypothetical protein